MLLATLTLAPPLAPPLAGVGRHIATGEPRAISLPIDAGSDIGWAGGRLQPARSDQAQATFSGRVEVVTLSVTVRDVKGRVVKGLARADFDVLDRGEARDVKAVFPGDTAISLAVLLDISGSMAVGGNMDRARQGVRLALGELQNGRDEAALYTFDHELQQAHGFTADLQRVMAISLEGRPWGRTSLFDAIGTAARHVSARSNRHRALLVVTDGVDTYSRMTAAEVSAIASVIDVPVYLLVVASPVDNPARRLAEDAGGAARTATLADLARWTGGDMTVVSAREDAAATIAGVMEEIRHRYLVSFEPDGTPGWHPLEVSVRGRAHRVRARGGYMAGPAPATSPDGRPAGR
ncbi:MAG: VWA domain-containing protein [Acidimicrobiia bacterium]|nr:VWA domain-containing protein [Acidimicrobiia bacterium]